MRVSTGADVSSAPSIEQSDDSHTLDDPGRYNRLIGKLIYLMMTRSYITFVVGVLSRFTHQPRETQWLVVLRVLAYIKSYPRKGLVYREHEHVRISGYSNSGYTGDQRDRKSTTGYCILVGVKSRDLEEQETKCCVSLKC